MRQQKEEQHATTSKDHDADFMVTNSLETSATNVPRYRSMRTTVDENENSANHLGKGGARKPGGPSLSGLGGEPSSSSARGVKPLTGLGRTSSKVDLAVQGSAAGGGSGSTTGGNSVQPRQKKGPSQSRPGTAAYNKQGMLPARAATRKQADASPLDALDYQVSGVQMTPNEFGAKFQKSSIRNDDICNELILSRDDLRYDQRERDRAAAAQKEANLMAEAEAVLAQTNEYFNARKRALVERHLEGRESLPDLDHILNAAPGGKLVAERQGNNYLDSHDAKLAVRQKEEEQEER